MGISCWKRIIGGLTLVAGELVLGWVCTTLNRKWLIEIVGRKSQPKLLFESEREAKVALLSELFP